MENSNPELYKQSVIDLLDANALIPACVLFHRPKMLIDGTRYCYDHSEIIFDENLKWKLYNRLLNAGNEVIIHDLFFPAKYKKKKPEFVEKIDREQMRKDSFAAQSKKLDDDIKFINENKSKCNDTFIKSPSLSKGLNRF